MQFWNCLQRVLKAFAQQSHACGEERMDAYSRVILSHPVQLPTSPVYQVGKDKARLSKTLAWKERKGLTVYIPPCHYSQEKILPFVNKAFDEFATEHTAAIQFCIGNSSKIPSTLDKEFNAALRAEGYDLNNLHSILKNVYHCAVIGRDTCGKKMAYETVTPMMHKACDGPFLDEENSSYFGMKEVSLFVERGWRGTCMLMVLKRTHRLFRNKNNCIMGFVVHTDSQAAAALLRRALKSFIQRKGHRKMRIRGLLYLYNYKSNCYTDVTASHQADDPNHEYNTHGMQNMLGENISLEFIQ